MIVILLGDIGVYLARLAKSRDPDACLLHADNFRDLAAGTYYTSLADIGGLFNLGLLLQQADHIVFTPPPDGRWSGGSVMKQWTQNYVENFSARCTVENFSVPEIDPDVTAPLVDQRRAQSRQLWVAGCSISHGVGIDEQDRYGTLLSKQLDLPVSFLTQPGSSITWAADQILRSDIRQDDQVVWGLTFSERLPYYMDHSVHHISVVNFSRDRRWKKIMPESELISDNTRCRNLQSLYQVRNFCDKIGARIMLASLVHSDIVPYIRHWPNLLVLSNLWGQDANELYADLGWDQEHPGPETHRFYAQQILSKLTVEHQVLAQVQ